MRVLTLLIVSTFAIPALAAPIFEFNLKTPYGSHITQVTKSKSSKWECKTEFRPMAIPMRKGINEAELQTLSKRLAGKKISDQCHDKVFAIDRTGKKPRSFVGCMSDPKLAKLINDTNSACLR